MKTMPRTPGLDNTLQMIRDPYLFISKICRNLKTNCFRTRIFGKSTICMTGPEAANLFYNSEFTTRKGAAPEPINATLLSKGAIQGMDDEAHKIRKELFMSFMTQEQINKLTKYFKDELKKSSTKWAQENQVIVYKEMQRILTQAVCSWTGVPLEEQDFQSRTEDLTAMFNSVAPSLMGHLRSRFARQRTEIWISELIENHRQGKALFSQNSIADIFSKFKDENRQLLSSKKAAIELINILRPTVAVSVFIIFTLHALTSNPQYQEKFLIDPSFRFCFIQEVRRFYPFFPSSVAKARTDFEFHGYKILNGQQLILDLYGTNHDSREWTNPDEFFPERFVTQKVTPFNFIPQGGGDHFTNHRCPGEHIAIALMGVAGDFFIKDIKYDLPKQNLSINFSRLPAIPESGFIISNVNLSRQAPLPHDTLSF